MAVKSMYDLRQLLKKYGIFIYTGNRMGDLEMMELEIRDLYDLKMISIKEYQQSLLLIRNEKANLN